mmetsp:Transcript_8900/g.17945  ORF Transcript_8900/g.17945 Transcript_8900/m.17945 type:complete len:86 (-) Transcript_8900:597-854(-)
MNSSMWEELQREVKIESPKSTRNFMMLTLRRAQHVHYVSHGKRGSMHRNNFEVANRGPISSDWCMIRPSQQLLWVEGQSPKIRFR